LLPTSVQQKRLVKNTLLQPIQRLTKNIVLFNVEQIYSILAI